MSHIDPNCIRRPADPVPRDYVPPGSVPYRVQDHDSWTSLADSLGIDAWELIRFNYPGLPENTNSAAREVNWYLQEYVGCQWLTPDRKNYMFSTSADPGIIYLPSAAPVEPPTPPTPPPPEPVPPSDEALSPGMYNLFWLWPLPSSPNRPMGASRQNTNTVDIRSRGIPAIIIYPAMLTPSIVVGAQDLEMLILTKPAKPLGREDVNTQLKVTRGLDPEKKYDDNPLFASLTDSDIRIRQLALGSDALKTPNVFAGILDPRALDLFRAKGYTSLYSVTLKNGCLRSGNSATTPFNQKYGDFLVPKEVQDAYIREVLEELNGPRLDAGGKYCFQLSSDDVNLNEIQRDNPIQSYHPVYYSADLHYANFAHLSDIHISSRQQILKHSAARVIDYVSGTPTVPGSEADLNTAPLIGGMLNICSQNLMNILGQIGSASSINTLLVGGDLIDYIRNAYWKNPDSLNAGGIWRALALDSAYQNVYQRFIDFITFYTLILNFLRTYDKPAFVVSGNHDCYSEPYGISPRIDLLVTERRANEGIPADHNLTIYEAILMFGRTYSQIISTSMFTKELFKWFYTILTPWANFWVKLPEQCLVGLAWGDDEDIIDFPPAGHGLGHLPRAEEAIADQQLSLLEEGIATGKKIILMTHFTFVSYVEGIPVDANTVGDVYFDWSGPYSDYDFGTFEDNRKPLYERLLGLERKIQCVVTGHSHRRGLYLIERVDYTGRNSVKTRFYDFPSLPAVRHSSSGIVTPAIVVSDSAGPIPRYNKFGEFNGWGSDAPSGSTITMDTSGAVANLTAVRSPCVPRLSVALDYLDIIAGEDVIDTFETDEFAIRDEQRGTLPSYAFRFTIKGDLVTSYRLTISDFHIYSKPSPTGAWYKVVLNYNPATHRWEITGADMAAFELYIASNRTRGSFLSIKFASTNPDLTTKYNFESPWNFEFQTDTDTSGGGLFGAPTRKKYILKRDKDKAEKPDFAWRERSDAKYR